MARRRINYREGDWFAVPLRDGGFAVGIVARMDRSGIIAGYFFGPRRETVPALAEVEGLDPRQALQVLMFGHLGLIKNEWPIIGRSDTWDRDRWPMPSFGVIDAHRGLAWRMDYPETNLGGPPHQTPISIEEAAKLPDDGLAGAGYVELTLTDLLTR